MPVLRPVAARLGSMGRGENAEALLDLEDVERAGLGGVFTPRVAPLAVVEALTIDDVLDPATLGEAVQRLRLVLNEDGRDDPQLRQAVEALAGKIVSGRHGADHHAMSGVDTASYLAQLSGADQAGSLRYAQPFRSDGAGGISLGSGGQYHLLGSLRAGETLCGKKLSPTWRIGNRFLPEIVDHTKKVSRCKNCYKKAELRRSDLELHKLLVGEQEGGRTGRRAVDGQRGERIISETAEGLLALLGGHHGGAEQIGERFLEQTHNLLAQSLADETIRSFEPLNGQEVFTALFYPAIKHHWRIDEQLLELQTYLRGLRVDGGLAELDSKELLRKALIQAYTEITSTIGSPKLGRQFIGSLLRSFDTGFIWKSKQAFSQLSTYANSLLED